MKFDPSKNFDPSKIGYIHLPPATFGSLSVAQIEHIFSDGRFLSPFMEAEAPNWFGNLVKKPESNFGDFSYSDGSDRLPLEMRGYSSLGKVKKADLIPNYMIGKDRKYDEDKYVEALGTISGWLIVCPVISYQNIITLHYPSSDALATIKKRLGQRDIKNILGATPDEIYKWITTQTQVSIVDNVVYEFDKPWKGKI